MVTVFITSFLLLAAISLAIYYWQRPSPKKDAAYALPPPQPYAGLFGEEKPEDVPALNAGSKISALAAEQRQALLKRAAQGEREALREAHATGDRSLYDEALNTLIERAESEKAVFALVSYIARSSGDLRVNAKLAESFMEGWKASPSRNSTAEMIHVAALADDAAIYQRAVEMAVQFWREGRLGFMSAEELRALIEGEYWLLSSPVRSSGTGFLLKRKLAAARRELQTTIKSAQ